MGTRVESQRVLLRRGGSSLNIYFIPKEHCEGVSVKALGKDWD